MFMLFSKMIWVWGTGTGGVLQVILWGAEGPIPTSPCLGGEGSI